MRPVAVRRRLVFSTIGVVLIVLGVIVGPVVYVISNSSADADLRGRLYVRLGVIALFAIAAAALLAAIQARQLAQPLERLARRAAQIGDGDFSATNQRATGIHEIDDIARALRQSANRVSRMLETERGFTADATHQLRTGLTGIAMRLELLERHPDPAIASDARAALNQTHELNMALDELLAVARKGSTGERAALDLVALVDHHVADWQQRYARRRRTLAVTTGSVSPVVATPGLVGQIINILLDNALRHGSGPVSVVVEGQSITIGDSGPGIPPGRLDTLFDRPTDHSAAHGRGLALARRLAEADGGRLELISPRPPVLRLTLLREDA